MVEREGARKFGPGISVQEAERERETKVMAVRESGFRVWVNWWAAEEWREEVREAVKRLGCAGGFIFDVDDEGVRMRK